MSSFNEKQFLLNKTNLPNEILLNIFKYDIDFNAKKIMDDIDNYIQKIYHEEKLINSLIEDEKIRIEEEENDYVASYLLEDDNYEIEILDESIPRKNINNYLEIIEDYLKNENKDLINIIVQEYFNVNINEIYDYDILTLYYNQHINIDTCHNSKFLFFLRELYDIYLKWSINYYDDAYGNESDIEDY